MTQDKQVVLVTGAGSGIGRVITLSLSRAGYQVYASMRDVRQKNHERVDALLQLARQENLSLEIIELGVLSEVGCQAAVNQTLAEQGHLDVVVNNAGMLMVGLTEAFSVEQVSQIIDTNALSWLRVNRAALPAMRRQGYGLLMYVGPTKGECRPETPCNADHCAVIVENLWRRPNISLLSGLALADAPLV